jgi:anti-sigma B factor antagonist
MGLQITARPLGPGIVSLRLDGQLDGQTYRSLDQEISRLLTESFTTFVLDMQDVDFVSSAGIGALVKTKASAKQRGGDVAMNGLQPQVRRVMDIMDLVPTLNVFANDAELDDYLARVQHRIVEGSDD